MRARAFVACGIFKRPRQAAEAMRERRKRREREAAGGSERTAEQKDVLMIDCLIWPTGVFPHMVHVVSAG